ncbi:hypothetical protein [Altererythrobacter lutimaris]|uniref:Heme exporter protein D n=1 Tax=Altererythrobacter lutimaris TaxID=2743979 RepID=A0A850H5B8_9SPHN|nr:hypothetical protein [Altererythrobacter lutimaris]
MMEPDPNLVREALNQWNFVIASYVVGVGGTLAMIAWSWFDMKRAETKREAVKQRGKDKGSPS